MPPRGISLVIQWLRLRNFTASGVGSIPGCRTKIPHVTRQKKKKKISGTPSRSSCLLSTSCHISLLCTCNKHCAFLHHDAVSIDWLYCSWASRHKFDSITGPLMNSLCHGKLNVPGLRAPRPTSTAPSSPLSQIHRFSKHTQDMVAAWAGLCSGGTHPHLSSPGRSFRAQLFSKHTWKRK